MTARAFRFEGAIATSLEQVNNGRVPLADCTKLAVTQIQQLEDLTDGELGRTQQQTERLLDGLIFGC